MIDIHTHILPQIDDGAGSVEEARAMVFLQRQQGVRRMFLTPHFYPDRMGLEDFLQHRRRAWETLARSLGEDSQIQIRLGAEVHFSPNILFMDLRQLCLGSSDYLLLELSSHQYPAYIEEVVMELLNSGITPILAHIERYPYFRKDPQLLKKLIDLSCIGQVSVNALIDRHDRNFAKACFNHDLAQIAASDAHNMAERKPCMEKLTRLSDFVQGKSGVFTHAVWENELPPATRPTEVKKGILGYV